MVEHENNWIELEVPARICLLGDKVDLLEKPVIAMAVDLLMKIRVKKRNDLLVRFYSRNLDFEKKFNLNNLEEAQDFDQPLKYWSAIFLRLRDKIGNSGFEAEVESNIPIGAGLSSSAALSVGLIKALNELFGLEMTTYEIAELAYICEHDDLGISCGRMDQYAIAYGGVLYIETGSIPKVEKLNVEKLPIVVADSMEERRASIILNKIKRQIEEKDPTVLKAFKEIEKIVYEGKKALLSGNTQKIGELMNRQQKQEGILQADTPKLNQMCNVAIKAGAYGAKQMGAGGGGCMEAICPPDKESEIKYALEKLNVKTWIFNVFNYN